MSSALHNFGKLLAAISVAMLVFSCAYPERTGFDRRTGGYARSAYSPSAQVTHKASQTQPTSSDASPSRLMTIIKPWMGTPYRLGGSTRSGSDCSGFVMSVLREWSGVKLPHGTRETWKMGESVSRSSLEPGDVVFFGSLWGVNHSGIYIGGGKMAHASTSQGVIITPLDDSYWSKRYKGARRY